MIGELKDSIDVPVRLQFTIGEGLPGEPMVEWRGVIKEFRRDDRILVFEHSVDEQKRMKIKESKIDLRSVKIWGLDILLDVEPVDEPEEIEEKLPDERYFITTLPCPHCNGKLHIIEKNQSFGVPSEDEE
jgi:hypothetical protein